MANLVDDNYMMDFFKDKTVMVLGSAPNVTTTKADFMESFDLIVRVNNYSHFNECKRTDVYSSFFGKSIRKAAIEILCDGCKLLMAKCPQEEIVCKNVDGSINDLLSANYAWIYSYRLEWFEKAGLPLYIQPVKNFCEANEKIGQICTTGVSTILDIMRYEPKKLYFAGFDFAMSGLHDINKKMRFKPYPDVHFFEKEFYLMRQLLNENEMLDCSDEIKTLFAGKYKRPPTWTE